MKRKRIKSRRLKILYKRALRVARKTAIKLIVRTAEIVNKFGLVGKAVTAYIKADKDSVNALIGMLAGLLVFGAMLFLWTWWPYIELYL